MAVEMIYVVKRNGEEKMTFTSKKAADAHDRMLDMADAFADWLRAGDLVLDDSQREAIGLHFAMHKETVSHILRTSKLPETTTGQQTSSDEEGRNIEKHALIRAVDAA
ncbi:DNA damage-inducible SOS regulon protein [Erwinia sp. OLTSP20]|uniref:YebG family protein n=1 Tax=unclassified Erwinia TaxID=2622719 RepID=UPI000C17F6B4|nr:MULTISPECIES: YebG family protein [unclassified Erwinia]PIJ51447.1 DNA damage-inducible SOS regulon protein [Erwinia sp. OAMSP11]PIJ73469.1 DNA damage-inducible SOS regulon protein [Erwinia sp. OLSSP12]PIJ85532.1 DNA damage-inducible SOS regulon protein [Erwinia sp. OLCASP19]PIJ85930.1 DNA damage-inducible SOS regulon protein [Erwinia sp. OLMTSP26]PIJ87411.1 DNA damage-inducible SOS regulon protein [Erwinia sp. OLMDSP33]